MATPTQRKNNVPTPLVIPTIPAVPSQTFDKFWIESFSISQQNVFTGSPAHDNIQVRIRYYYVDSNNNKVFAPKSKIFILPNATASNDPNASSAIDAIYAAIESWLTNKPAYVMEI